MVSSSRGSTLTPCKSPTPEIPVQPDHFYGTENVQLPPSPDSDGKTWLDPADDPMAHRGIPVFKPTMEEFKDFEGYMNKVECWGSKSGIIKVIPPKEWTASLPALKSQLSQVKIKSPIEQHMLGNAGLFRQENMEKRKLMSVREWVELCSKDEFRAPGVFDVGLTSRGANTGVRSKTQRKGKQKVRTVEAESAGPAVVIKQEPSDECLGSQPAATPPHSEGTLAATPGPSKRKKASKNEKPKPRAKRAGPTREAREASLANRAALDRDFIEDFSPHKEWLPSNTEPTDYTPEFCQKLERQFWRNCGLGKPAWYGADSQGSLFTDATTTWNVAHLPSTLSRLLPSSDQGLPGVNTPYLYFGMWRATFAWHVEDMDLFSINYIHFGAPKFWYAIPQGRAAAMEQTMRGYFPKDTSQCPQFLRHKSFLASPSILANSACRPNYLVQQSGEFVVTFPRGYHAGFNLGLNCAESVNFALESWLDVGRRAKACECVSDSVRIDVDELLRQREEECNTPLEGVAPKLAKTAPKKKLIKEEMIDITIPPSKSRKRKSEAKDGDLKAKKIKVNPSMANASSKAPSVKLSVTLKLGPRPVEPEPFPCCLCVSMGKEGLLRVHDPPINRREATEATGNPKSWMAHDICANIVPETWVDSLDTVDGCKEKVVFGVDGIVKDRWNLKCSACTKTKSKAHGAPVQCTKGKCPKAFHVNCARDGHEIGIMFTVMREVKKEVVLLDPSPSSSLSDNRSESMNIDSNHTTSDSTMATAPIPQSSLSRVLKVIKKLDVQILCTQHNPAVAALKKASKQDKIRNDLLALPSMARIKIRVSAGVFEVSLIRVIEETSSVEVLWDRGVKREFKWGSVVFGSTDGPVQQKPSEIVVEPERPVQCTPVSTFPSVTAATSQQRLQPTGHRNLPAATTSSTVVTTGTTVNPQYSGGTTPYMYSLRTGPFDYWAYASQYSSQANQTQYPYTYNGYYPTTQTAGIAQHHNPYTYTQTYNQNQNRNSQLNWQRPYHGPSAQEGISMGQGTGTIHRFRLGPGPSSQSPSGRKSPAQTSITQEQQTHCQSQPNQNPPSTSSEQPALDNPTTSESLNNIEKSSAQAAPSAPAESSTCNERGLVEQVSVHKDLSVLSSLQPSQIAEILCNNPEIQSIVWAAVDQAMAKARDEANEALKKIK